MAGRREGQRRSGFPNVLILFTDQQRWDTLGIYGCPMDLTPNLDRLGREGVKCEVAITNQPVCAPARACLWTGQYASRHGVWRNGLGLSPETRTIAHCFKEAGYTVGYIGKWHLSPRERGVGPVPPEYRGGFTDFWEASNVLEHTSHPYEVTLFDAEGRPIHIADRYRVDILTDRAVEFLRRDHKNPFLLVISWLEPHQQNDWNRVVAPKGYAQKYKNPFVPPDLRPFWGDWQEQLPDYYGCIARIDECVARLLETLKEQGLMDDTLIVFLSDHGCHFRTRNEEYKRSCHESSIRIPLIFWGHPFPRSLVVPEIVNIVDVAPTLLDAVGIPIPETMQGKSILPLLERKVDGWRNEAFIQISESMVGRALRTERWKYCVVAPDRRGEHAPDSPSYQEYQLYDLFSDPYELMNLAGRREVRRVAEGLRERLKAHMEAVGERIPDIHPAPFYP